MSPPHALFVGAKILLAILHTNDQNIIDELIQTLYMHAPETSLHLIVLDESKVEADNPPAQGEVSLTIIRENWTIETIGNMKELSKLICL